jgi:STE24 endopeptidase
MHSTALTLLFATALLASLLVKFWLSTRQMRHVAAHRGAVPEAFAATIPLEAHQKAADYTLAKGRFSLLTTAFSAAVLVGWTFLGGLDALNAALRDTVAPRWGDMAYQLSLVIVFSVIGSALELPFNLYATFVLEQRFGFNRTTWKLYVADLLRDTVVGLLTGVPILALVLWLMGAAGSAWWLLAWGVIVAYMLLMQVIHPLFIAPWYNKYEPLKDELLTGRVETLMARCGFRAKGLFVKDGSKRSGHANAEFTGLGRSKRVIFYDTLLSKLSPAEMEAVLAHELGHFSHKHVLKLTLLLAAFGLGFFALLGWLSGQTWFYTALGVQPSLNHPNDAVALLLFMMVVPVFAYFISPLFAQLSRRNEFEADTYACSQASGADLAGALLKLHKDNASTLTPDPLYVRFYYSHPAALERMTAIQLQTSRA